MREGLQRADGGSAQAHAGLWESALNAVKGKFHSLEPLPEEQRIGAPSYLGESVRRGL